MIKPAALLPTAILIYQVKGEDAARLWYDRLTEEQQAQFQSDLAEVAANVTARFREIGEIMRAQSNAITTALRPLAEALEAINEQTTRPV